MQKMNYAVDKEKIPVETVVRNWLKSHSL